MAALSPGSRVQGKRPASIQFGLLGDAATTSVLSTLHTLVRTSFGPRGKLKLLHNNSGGHSTVTSSSARLFASLSISNPILRLLTTAIQGHVGCFSDGGLFTALLALSVIRNSLAVDVPRRLVMEVHELLLRHSVEYLSSAHCSVRQTVDIGNLRHLDTIVRSVIGTKLGCGLSAQDLEHLSGLIVRAFLKTFQGGSDKSSQLLLQGIVNHVALEGRPPSESQLFDGVLFAVPQIPTYRIRPLECPHSAGGSIRVALFTTSLAGDSEDVADVVHEVFGCDDASADLEAAVLSTLEDLVCTLVAAEVGLVCCQRVIHPFIKQRLRIQGLLVIDRLGSSQVAPIQALTGATLLGSFVQPPTEGAYGRLDGVSHVVLGGRSYLHLARRMKNVCTLVTCQRTESASDELKHVSAVCQDVLRRALLLPDVLAGGGCWQVNLAAIIRTLLVANSSDWCGQLGCSRLQLSQAAHAFCLALDQVAMATSNVHQHMTDSTNQHHWALADVPISGEDRSKEGAWCCCGQHCSSGTTKFEYLGQERINSATRKDVKSASSELGTAKGMYRVVDLFEVSVNGLKTAVAAANMVLGIQYYIHDTN